MINDAKINFHLSGDTNVNEIGTEVSHQYGPYKNIISTIARLNRHAGEFYVVMQITNKPADDVQGHSDPQLLDFLKLLTRREAQVYCLAMEGIDNRSIADQLYISIETVKCHRKSIIKKAGVKRIEDIKNFIVRRSTLFRSKNTSQG